MASKTEALSNNDEATFLIDESGKPYPLQSSCEIGRKKPCYLVVKDARISRKHCLIQKDSSNLWWITDLDSSNGTYVNNHRISKATQLSSGDHISIGNSKFTFSNIQDKVLDTDDHTDASSDGTNIIFTQANCWLLVADIVGSTALSQNLSPQYLNVVIGEWRTLCESTIQHHNGEINQYLGDGFFAYWNGDDTDGDAIIATIRELRELKSTYQLEFRIMGHHD